jgi:hypothetical protein
MLANDDKNFMNNQVQVIEREISTRKKQEKERTINIHILHI